MNDRGMTLMELLVGLSVAGLLSVLLFGSVQLGAQSWESAERAKAILGDAERLERLFGPPLEYAYPIRIAGADRPVVAFEGRETEIEFVTALPREGLPPGLKRTEFVLDQGRSGLGVVSRFAPYDDNAIVETTETNEGRLGCRTAQFSFYGRKRGQAEAEWHSVWSEEADMPRLIRLQLRPMPECVSAPAEYVVAPKLTGRARCLYDRLSGRCRG